MMTTDRPSAETFLTGWTIQNVNTADPGKAAALAIACMADAQARGLDADEVREAAGGDLEQRMLREIAAYADAAPQRLLSRDD
jgi:hypothetical protein